MKIRIPGQDEKPTFMFVPNPTILTHKNIIPNVREAMKLIPSDKMEGCELFGSNYFSKLCHEIDTGGIRYTIDDELPDHEFYILDADGEVLVLYTIRIAEEVVMPELPRNDTINLMQQGVIDFVRESIYKIREDLLQQLFKGKHTQEEARHLVCVKLDVMEFGLYGYMYYGKMKLGAIRSKWEGFTFHLVFHPANEDNV